MMLLVRLKNLLTKGTPKILMSGGGGSFMTKNIHNWKYLSGESQEETLGEGVSGWRKCRHPGSTYNIPYVLYDYVLVPDCQYGLHSLTAVLS